ncbi:hypothetical protein Tco_0596298 [Tanacetum coccineum]
MSLPEHHHMTVFGLSSCSNLVEYCLQPEERFDYAYLLWEDFISSLRTKVEEGSAMYFLVYQVIVKLCDGKRILRFREETRSIGTTPEMIQCFSYYQWLYLFGNEPSVVRGYPCRVALTNEDIRNSESYKEYYAMASGTIPPKTKGSKKKANTDAIPKLKLSTAPKKQKSGTGKQKTSELENISEADLTEAEQLKIPGVPDAPDYDSDDDISWKSSDDDQDDEQDQDDDDAEKHEVHETTQEEEDDDEHDDDENDQEDDDARDDDKKAEDDDDEEMTESDNDGDDFVHPKLTTHEDEIIHEKDTDEDDSSISSSVRKSGEDAKVAKDQEMRQSKIPIPNLMEEIKANQSICLTRSPPIPGSVDQDLAIRCRKQWKFCSQLSYERFREESLLQPFNKFIDSIDKDMKKIIMTKSKRKVYKVISKSRENLIYKGKLYQSLVVLMKLDKILFVNMAIRSQSKEHEMVQMYDQEPRVRTDRGSKRRRSGKEPASTSAPSETTTRTAGKTTSSGSKTHTKSASQSAPVGDASTLQMSLKNPTDQEFVTGVQEEQAEEDSPTSSDWFKKNLQDYFS